MTGQGDGRARRQAIGYGHATATPGAGTVNRVYYRGTVPGERRRITSGDAWWRGHLFVAARIETALSYGPDIETVVFRDDARILMARTEQFAAVEAAAGAVLAKGEALIWASAVARQAEREGYAAVDFGWFIGAIVLDESAVVRGA